MADIKLKNTQGNYVTYTGIDKVHILGTDGNPVEFSIGSKSLILPTNPTFSMDPDNQSLALTWTAPTSEVAIDHYNIYYSTSDPSSLSDMTKAGETSNLTYTITGLTNGSTYYVLVESVTAEDYENASMLNKKSDVPYNFLKKYLFVKTGTVCTSVSGKEFSLISSIQASFIFENVCVFNNNLYAIGDEIYTSLDGGITWSPSGITVPWGSLVSIRLVKVVNNVLFVVTNSATYMTSDALVWSTCTGFPSDPYDADTKIDYVSGKYIISNITSTSYDSTTVNFYYSTDGVNWTLSSSTYSFSGAYYQYIQLASNGTIAVSTTMMSSFYFNTTDGITWNKIEQLGESSFPSGTWNYVFYVDNNFILVSNDLVFTSIDGESWTQVSTIPVTTFYANNDVVLNKKDSKYNLFINSSARGGCHLLISSDLINWTYSKVTIPQGMSDGPYDAVIIPR